MTQMEEAHTTSPSGEFPVDTKPFTPHPQHYYEDGNIVLVAERTMFKLYRGLLARHSEAFRNMFNDATSVDDKSQEMIDGVPGVTLTDSAEDVAHLLDFLLTPNVPPYPPPSPPFETLLSLLRISSKYIFDSIRETAVWHLRQILPTTLEDFVANPGLTMFTDIRAAQVATAARIFNLPEFLPFALYAIATYAWRRTDAESAALVYSALPPGDAARITVARETIHSEALKMAFTMHEHGLLNSPCANPVVHSRICAKGKPALLWLNPVEALEEFLRNPLRQLVIREHCEFHSLCKVCNDTTREKMRQDLVIFYKKLPEIFQLESTTPNSPANSQKA
ncbi:hypothetical protein FRB99_005569 [Tulasnella sp. 403]|nr:hypothetical protein FRB99_005569 [Tulasnella sp. 403]